MRPANSLQCFLQARSRWRRNDRAGMETSTLAQIHSLLMGNPQNYQQQHQRGFISWDVSSGCLERCIQKDSEAQEERALGLISNVCHFVIVQSLSCVPLFATPWTPSDSSVHGVFHSKNTNSGCHFLLQGIFLTQGSNLCLLHWQVNSLPLSHQGSPVQKIYLIYVY